jgi:hypothetical protein
MRLLLLSFLLLTATLSADSLILLNGSIVKGTLIGADNRTIRFAVGNQIKTHSLADVDSIRFGASDTTTESSALRPNNYRPASAPAIRERALVQTARLVLR